MNRKKKLIAVACVSLLAGCILGTSVITNALELNSSVNNSETTSTNKNWELKTIPSGNVCTELVTTLYEDDDFTYTVPNPCYIEETYVVYSNGRKVNIKTALSKNYVSIEELMDAGANIEALSKVKIYNWELKRRKTNKVCTEALETIYEDDDYVYQVPNACYASEYYIKFNTGKKYSIKYALQKGLVTPDELIEQGAEITKEPKVKAYDGWHLEKRPLVTMCAQVQTTFYEDDEYEYQVPNSCYANEYYVVFADETSYTIKEALEQKIVTVDELIEKGAEITKEAKVKAYDGWRLERRPLVTMCTEALTTFYEDDEYEYQVPNSCYAAEYYVVYSNGKEYSMKYALRKKLVTVDELIEKGAKITRISKTKAYNWSIEYRPLITMCTQELVTLYEDSNYVYQVPNSCYANEYYIVFTDGTSYTIKEAVDENVVTVENLIDQGLKIYKSKK